MKKHSTTKRLLSAFVAVLFVMTMFSGLTTAFAVDENAGDITLKLAQDAIDNGLTLEGMRVKAWKVLSAKEVGSSTTYQVTTNFETFFGYNNGSYAAYDAVKEAAKTGGLYIGYDDNEGKLTYKTSGTNADIFIPADEVAKFDETYLAAEILAYVNAGSGDKLTANARKMSEFLRKYVAGVAVDAEKTADEDETEVGFDNLLAGYWFLLSENTPDGVANVEAVFKVSPRSSETYPIKAEYPTIEKKVKYNGEWEDATTAGAGDILDYQISFKIQDMSNYNQANQTYVYTITDTMENQKLVDADGNPVSGLIPATPATDFPGVFTITFTNKATGATGTTTYTYSDEDGATNALAGILNIGAGKSTYGSYVDGTGKYVDKKVQTFVLDFNVAALRALWANTGNTFGDEVEVTIAYKAELTSDATTVNGNDVSRNYSNNPYLGSENTTDTDDTDVYSFELDVDKDFSDGSKNFGGVEFTLYDSTGKEVVVTGSAGNYAVADKEVIAGIKTAAENAAKDTDEYKALTEDGEKTAFIADAVEAALKAAAVLKLDGNGNLLVTGLAPGQYTLKETKSPNGFSLAGDVDINITVTEVKDNEGNITDINISSTTTAKIGDTSVIDDSDTDDDTLGIDLLNQKDFEMPETGGMGILLFGISGVLLIAAAAYILISQKKRNQA